MCALMWLHCSTYTFDRWKYTKLWHFPIIKRMRPKECKRQKFQLSVFDIIWSDHFWWNSAFSYLNSNQNFMVLLSCDSEWCKKTNFNSLSSYSLDSFISKLNHPNNLHIHAHTTCTHLSMSHLESPFTCYFA